MRGWCCVVSRLPNKRSPGHSNKDAKAGAPRTLRVDRSKQPKVRVTYYTAPFKVSLPQPFIGNTIVRDQHVTANRVDYEHGLLARVHKPTRYAISSVTTETQATLKEGSSPNKVRVVVHNTTKEHKSGIWKTFPTKSCHQGYGVFHARGDQGRDRKAGKAQH